MSSKVIRDPVHDHIYLDTQSGDLILRLLDTPEVQRLRRIHQLGVGYLTYPGAEHSRFSHSLGVYHLMRKALTAAVERSEEDAAKLNDLEYSAALAAALLHDIGHGPFSHVLERKFGGDHEKRTHDLIKDSETGVNRVLAQYDSGLPRLVCDLLAGKKLDLLWLRALITSQLDVDRMDYLLRDSHFCGVGYGRYDHEYLFHTMRICRIPPDDHLQPVWLEKASRVIEEYLFARYYMHWNVYYHHTTKGYEELLNAICDRAGELLKGNSSIPATDALRKFVCCESLANCEFAGIDDNVLLFHIAIWQNEDGILGDLCKRFLNRDGLKPIVARAGEPIELIKAQENLEQIKRELESSGLDPTYYLRESTLEAKTYDYYHPEKETAEHSAINSILVRRDSQDFEEISRMEGMERLGAVTGRRERRRIFYVPSEHRERVRKLLHS